MKKAFVIMRLSTEDQLKGYGADVQWDDDILQNASMLGLEVNESYRRVIQESATGWERSKFETAVREALSLYQRGDIEALVFPRVDRETRFLFGSFPLLAEVVRAGLRVYFAREKLALDPNDPESIERYLNKATQAQAYVETMRVNTLRAKEKLLKKGILPQGTGIGMYGFKWDKQEKKRVPLDFEVKILQKIFTMYDSGTSAFQIAKSLNDQGIPTKSGGRWHPLTISRILANSAYIGLTYFRRTLGSRKTVLKQQPRDNWLLLPGATPLVIEKELFDRVQEKLQQNRELRRGHPKYDYLLTGHIVCGYCGSPMIGCCLNRGRYRYYHCRGYYETATRGKICSARYIRADFIERIVWDKIREVLENPDVILAELKRQAEAQANQTDSTTLDKEIANLQRRLRRYDYDKKRLFTLFRHEGIDENDLLDELNQVKKDHEVDEARLSVFCQTREQICKLAQAEMKLSDFCERVRQNLSQCALQEKRLALDALDIKVISTQENTEIKGVIPIEVTATQSSHGSLTIEQTWA